MVKKNAYDAVVIGGGIIGAATACSFAEVGMRTLLLEQHYIGHIQGSSHGFSREFGDTHADPIDRKLARRSYKLWRKLEKESGETLLTLTGGIEIGTDAVGRHSIEEVAQTLRAERQPCEVLHGKTLRRRYPQWQGYTNASALYSPHTGVLWADRCLQAVVRVAKKHGAVIREHARAVSVQSGSEGIKSIGLASGETYHARRLVIAAGPWAPRFLRSLGVTLPLRVSQVQTVYFAPRRNPERFLPKNFPIWTWDADEYVYGFPMLEKQGIKISFHTERRYLKHLREYRKVPRASVTRRLRAFLAEHLPDAAGEVFDATTCLYTETPDNDFVIDAIPDLSHTAYFAGCAGHAFHCAPAIGNSLVALACGQKRPTIDISKFSAKRFAAAHA